MYVCNMPDYILYLHHLTKGALPELRNVANNGQKMANFSHKNTFLLQPVLIHLIAQRSSGNL